MNLMTETILRGEMEAKRRVLDELRMMERDRVEELEDLREEIGLAEVTIAAIEESLVEAEVEAA